MPCVLLVGLSVSYARLVCLQNSYIDTKKFLHTIDTKGVVPRHGLEPRILRYFVAIGIFDCLLCWPFSIGGSSILSQIIFRINVTNSRCRISDSQTEVISC